MSRRQADSGRYVQSGTGIHGIPRQVWDDWCIQAGIADAAGKWKV